MTSTVNCDYTGANWEFNSEGENPCMVYAELQGVCDSGFRISQVTSTSPPYTPPNNACGCNVVAYNLMAACGWCQSTIQTSWWLTVDQWAGNCTSASYDTTGVPDSVSTATINIPAWALVAPTSTSWSPSQASNIALPFGSSTATTGFATGSTTRGFTFTTPSYTGYPYNYPYYDYGPAVNVAAIVCGVIFGLYALVLIAVVAAYFIRQNKRKAWYGPMARYYAAQRGFGGGQPGYGQPMVAPYAPNQNTAAGVPLLYNPANYNSGTPVPNSAYPNTPSTNYQIPPNMTGTTSNQSYQPPPPEGYTGAPTPVGYQPPPADQGGMYGGVPNTNSVYGAPPQGPPNTTSMYGTPPPGAGGAPHAGNPNAAAFKGHAEVY
ncbi:hypothetical protein CPB86DRAFT_788394 [Serendipita vermifera]|nr:hypothetical protein CPB86DRAFT_788394 [Serendipita vermifera]